MKLLKKPYPISSNFKLVFTYSFVGATIIPFFLYYFKVVEKILNYELSIPILILLSLIVFFNLFIFDYISPILFPNIFNKETWSVKNEIIRRFLVYFIMSILINALYVIDVYLSSGIIDLSKYLTIFISTITFGIIPTIIVVLYSKMTDFKLKLKNSENNNTKKHIAQVEKITEVTNPTNLLNDTQILTIPNSNENFDIEIPVNDFYYLKMVGDYCEIFMDKEDSTILKMNFYDIEDSFLKYNILKCHDKYIVNIDKVSGVSGNDQGLRLQFNNKKRSIPVSKIHLEKISNSLIKK